MEISPNASLLELYETIHNVFELKDSEIAVFKERNFTCEVNYFNMRHIAFDDHDVGPCL